MTSFTENRHPLTKTESSACQLRHSTPEAPTACLPEKASRDSNQGHQRRFFVFATAKSRNSAPRYFRHKNGSFSRQLYGSQKSTSHACSLLALAATLTRSAKSTSIVRTTDCEVARVEKCQKARVGVGSHLLHLRHSAPIRS